ncbi:hypothetical protein CASFOL_014107 [Castilleja foliolosa]|uniref:Uncharacterized protein n=1 Tax=Castilleja foliolosa TaxID=1961234 RepID=A0ABD3DPQ6_9LAMI
MGCSVGWSGTGLQSDDDGDGHRLNLFDEIRTRLDGYNFDCWRIAGLASGAFVLKGSKTLNNDPDQSVNRSSDKEISGERSKEQEEKSRSWHRVDSQLSPPELHPIAAAHGGGLIPKPQRPHPKLKAINQSKPNHLHQRPHAPPPPRRPSRRSDAADSRRPRRRRLLGEKGRGSPPALLGE